MIDAIIPPYVSVRSSVFYMMSMGYNLFDFVGRSSILFLLHYDKYIYIFNVRIVDLSYGLLWGEDFFFMIATPRAVKGIL